MDAGHKDIRIGTLVFADSAPDTIRQIIHHGFESYQLTFGERIGDVDLDWLADQLRDILGVGADAPVISALGIYGNPLMDDETASDWDRLLRAASKFGCSLVTGFTGRLPDRSVPDCIPRFAEVFRPLVATAEEHAVRIAFENCEMGGDWCRGTWNIAHSPAAWELIFETIPSDMLGLEWEPCHQMVSLIEPLPQLRQWLSKVFHVHGKDANILWDVVRQRGIRSGEPYVFHRTPGFGDTNWADLIGILRMGGYRGSIDIEGWHDPVYRDELEMTGQVHGLNYLKSCRGGPFVPNPGNDI